MTALSEPIAGTRAAAAARCLQSRALSRCLELPVLGGNSVEVLHGLAGRKALYDAVDQAADHINIEMGRWPDGERGDQWLAHLLACVRQGARVNLMLAASDAGASPELLQRLRRGGVRLCESRASLEWPRRLGMPGAHALARSLVVLDGRIAFLGSFETAASDADGLLRIEGPAVAELQWLFIDRWRQQATLPLQAGRYFPALPWVGTHRVGIALAEDDADHTAHLRTLLAAVDAAQDRVLIAARGWPDKVLRRALTAACSRGVDVHLLWSRSAARHGIGSWSARWAILLQAGVHGHELQYGVPLTHVSVIDGVWTSIAVASDAASGAGEGDHVIVLDAEFGAQAEAEFWGAVARASAIAPAELAQGPLQRLNLRLARYLEVSS